jgi:hypothetical protein
MSEDLERVSALIEFLRPCFVECTGPRPAYDHIAALLADVSLQAAVNHARIVAPRITWILTRYPSCIQTHDLVTILRTVSTEEFLQWRGTEKVQRFEDLVKLVASRGIADVPELARWVETTCARTAVLAINGIGQKTFDYLRLLCGNVTFPIDRHIIRFLKIAGIDIRRCGYDRAQQLLSESCNKLSLEPFSVEKGLWNLMRSCS